MSVGAKTADEIEAINRQQLELIRQAVASAKKQAVEVPRDPEPVEPQVDLEPERPWNYGKPYSVSPIQPEPPDPPWAKHYSVADVRRFRTVRAYRDRAAEGLRASREREGPSAE
jgi:hypothetical protein